MGGTAFGRNRVELLEAGRITFERRTKKNIFAVGRPPFHRVRTPAEGQLARLATLGRYQIYIEVTAILPRECDQLAIGREMRIRFLSRTCRELSRLTAFPADAPEFSTI